jgi:hypothetical protein
MIRVDKYSGIEFETNKLNKHFSCKENQIKYNNELLKAARLRHRFIDEKLKKNEDILNQLLEDNDKIVVTTTELKKLGFFFKVITHYGEIDGVQYLSIYEYTYRQKNDNELIISKNGTDI